eukprot:356338-Chlamydomonas_euryale.AAC.3
MRLRQRSVIARRDLSAIATARHENACVATAEAAASLPPHQPRSMPTHWQARRWPCMGRAWASERINHMPLCGVPGLHGTASTYCWGVRYGTEYGRWGGGCTVGGT